MAELANLIDAAPLLRALRIVAMRGRRRKETGVDDEAVELGRIAFAALAWRDADEAGDLMEAQQWLDKLDAADRRTFGDERAAS